MSSAVTKKGMTQRHSVIHSANGQPSNLSGKVLTVKLSAGSTVVTATSELATQSGGTLGQFHFDVTAANITALGLTDAVKDEAFTVHVTLLNPDTTLFASAKGAMMAVL